MSPLVMEEAAVQFVPVDPEAESSTQKRRVDCNPALGFSPAPVAHSSSKALPPKGSPLPKQCCQLNA